MQKSIQLEASVACANFAHLETDLEQLRAGGIDYLHIDIMDGRFVNNFCLDFSLMGTLQRLSDIPMDCHLMIEEPERYLDRAAAAGARFITVHVEATHHTQKALQQIRDRGAKAGVALNPATPISSLDYILDDIDMVTVMTVNPGYVGQKLVPSTLRKIADVRRLLDSSGHEHVEIQVDGNVSFQNISAMVAAGATMLVGGTSSVFHKDYSIGEAIAAVRTIVNQTERVQ